MTDDTLRDRIARALSTQTTCDGEPYPSELHYRQADAVLDELAESASGDTAATSPNDDTAALGEFARAVAAATPCTCSAQRARAERAETAIREYLAQWGGGLPPVWLDRFRVIAGTVPDREQTAHTHTTYVPGCYRCGLSLDEATDSMRHAYADYHYEYPSESHTDGLAEFDAWLAMVKAEAWDEGHRFTGFAPQTGENPYREKP